MAAPDRAGAVGAFQYDLDEGVRNGRIYRHGEWPLPTMDGIGGAGQAEKGFGLCPEPQLGHVLLAATTDAVLAIRHRLECTYNVSELKVMVACRRLSHRCRLHGIEAS